MQDIINQYDFILSEGAVVERLRRTKGIVLHKTLEHSPLIYTDPGRTVMRAIYLEYLRIAQDAHTPILLSTPTWRANRERVELAGSCPTINIDAVAFLRELTDAHRRPSDCIRIGGIIGCKNDCYRPEQGLSAVEAEQFHHWQIQQLAEGGVDFLTAVTLPSVEEALGIANAMSHSAKPYFISFVIDKNCCVLDGTPLSKAIAYVDNFARKAPMGYFINCSYPSFLRPAEQDRTLFKRLLGMQANASSLEHSELDGCSELKSEKVEDWGALMLELNRVYGLKILGGCCGTGPRHLNHLVENR